MTHERITTTGAPAAIGPYSQAIRVGAWLYLSGQIPLIPETGVVLSSDVGEETHQVMRNLKAVLTAAGATMQDVVKCTVFLKDLSDFEVVNRVYGSYFGATPPARSTVQVARLPRDARVEIDAIAHLAPR
ncbi:MAG TPA: RidA family protein [Planctomycetota bacterium]|nr:RidA family protein [Planctomycetota bacterium]